MIRTLAEYFLSLAHGWAAGVGLLSVFYVAGLLLTPRSWQRHTRWPDSVVAGMMLYIVLAWVGVTSRNIRVVYAAFVYVGLLWLLASLRTQLLQATLVARVRSSAARDWLVVFSILYALAFIAMHPAAGSGLLPLGGGGNVDLVTYARYARQLLTAGTPHGVELAPFGFERSPASMYLLAAHSLFFGLDPLNAAAAALVLQVALLGMLADRVARSVFGVPRAAAIAVACVVVCSPVSRWLLTSYALAEAVAAVAMLYCLSVAARVAVNRAIEPTAFAHAATGAVLLTATAPLQAGWFNVVPSGLLQLFRSLPLVSLAGSPVATPAPADLTVPIRSAAVVVLAVLPLFWAGIIASVRRWRMLDWIGTSATDRQLSAALAVYAAAAIIMGNVTVQAVMGPAPARRPAEWRQLGQASGLSFASVTLKVADEAEGLSSALALYYLPGRKAEAFGRGVSLQALPFENVTKQHPMLIQNFRCEGAGHADALFVAGVGCLLMAPPSPSPGTSYPFNQTFLFLDFDRMTAREPGGRWNTRPTLNLRVAADPQRAGLAQPVFLNFLVNPFLPEGVKPQRLVVSWGNGQRGETSIAERQWFSLPVASGDWTGNRLWTLPIRIDFLDGRTILFHEMSLTENPLGVVVAR